MEKVERIQYQAALAVTGAWQGSSRVKLYDELGWESLSERRMWKSVLQIHKIVDRRTPSYLRDKMPPNHAAINCFNRNVRYCVQTGKNITVYRLSFSLYFTKLATI